MGCKIADRNSRQKSCLEKESQGKTEARNQPFLTGYFGKGILDNDTYNLMEQLEIESKSLWRIKNSYENDPTTDSQSRQLWSFIENEKEEVVRLLTQKIRERL